MNMKSVTFASAAVLSFALAGCGHSEVDAVKAASVPQDPTHTYETALSKRDSCEKDAWHTFKDDTNRMVVEYRCDLKNGVELLAALRQQKIHDTQSDYQGYYRGIDQSIESTKQGPETWQKLLDEAQAKLAQLQANGAQANANIGQEDPAQALRRAVVNNEMGAVASAKFSVEQAQEHLNDATGNLERNLASLQQERARFEQSEKDALAQIDKTYSGVTRTSEVFQWFVRDDQVVPAHAGVELEKQDGSVTRLDRDWRLTMRDLLSYRGEDHVRYVLNVPANVVPG